MTFLRPAFLILLLVPIGLFFLHQKAGTDSLWKKWIDANLLPHLLVHAKNKKTKRTPFWMLSLIWTLWTLALAGPSIEMQTPVYQNTNSTVIVLDLNSTGAGRSWINVRAKLSDLLTQLTDEQVALVLYDTKGYIVTPLSSDKNILRTMIPTLGADILPTAQNKPETGFQTAAQLLDNIRATDGRILFITAGGFDEKPLADFIQKSPYQTAVLFVPNTPDDTLSLPAPIQTRTADDSDIRALIAATPQSADGALKTDTQTRARKDMGIWLVVFSVPFLLFLCRSTVLFLIGLTLTTPADAHLFWRPDQQAYHQTQQAVSDFNAGQFDRAHSLFLNTDATYELPADALYNAANALAHAGKINEAIALYEKALEQNPTHADAKFNKEYLEKQLPPQQSDGESNNTDNQSSDSNESDVDSDTQQQSNQPQSSATDENTDSKTENNSQQENESDTSESNTDNADSNDKTSSDSEQSDKPSTDTQDGTEQNQPTPVEQPDSQPEPLSQTDSAAVTPSEARNTALNQEKEQLFNRIQEDPARLLRNRIYQQYRRQQ